MTIHHLAMDLAFDRPTDDNDDTFDECTIRVLDELCNLEDVDSGIVAPDITATITHRELSVHVGVEADSDRNAVRLFAANVRVALHAASSGTPGWPEHPIDLPAPRTPEYA